MLPPREKPDYTNKARSLDQGSLDKVRDPLARMSFILQREFGLRQKEALMIRPHEADRGDRLHLQDTWTKGGKPRDVPLTTPGQRQALDEAKTLVPPGRALIPADKEFHQQRRVYKNEADRASLSKLHGLRHAYAQRRYMNSYPTTRSKRRRLALSRKRRTLPRRSLDARKEDRRSGPLADQQGNGTRPSANYLRLSWKIDLDPNLKNLKGGIQMNKLFLNHLADILDGLPPYQLSLEANQYDAQHQDTNTDTGIDVEPVLHHLDRFFMTGDIRNNDFEPSWIDWNGTICGNLEAWAALTAAREQDIPLPLTQEAVAQIAAEALCLPDPPTGTVLLTSLSPLLNPACLLGRFDAITPQHAAAVLRACASGENPG